MPFVADGSSRSELFDRVTSLAREDKGNLDGVLCLMDATSMDGNKSAQGRSKLWITCSKRKAAWECFGTRERSLPAQLFGLFSS